MDADGYTLQDVAHLADDIEALLPEATFESHMDYGWRMDVLLQVGHSKFKCVTACQPRRPERDQEGFILTAKEVVAKLMEAPAV